MNYIEIAAATIAETYPYISHAKPPLFLLPPGTIIGTWAYSIPGRVRYMIAPERQIAPGVLPADVTRAWIKDTINLPLRRRKSQFNSHYSSPLLAQKGVWGDCAYVDIRHAYLDILKLGYDLEYVRMKYLGIDPKPIPLEIQKEKFCYSIAIAMSGSKLTNLSLMGKEGLFTQYKFNTFSNPCLFALACDLLASVASEVVAAMGKDVKYINTDGYIVPTKYVHVLQSILTSWNLESRIKYQGETEVFGVSAWKIGDHATKRHDQKNLDFASKLPTKEERRWLKSSYVRLAEKCDILLTE